MSLLDSIRSALATPSRHESGTAVHDVVAKAIRDLDPGIAVRTTDYFTHSFVPDLVVSWDEGERRESRPIHLRFSVSEHEFSQDLRFLADESPLFWGLIDTTPISSVEASPSSALTNGTLVTQTIAAERLSEGVQRDHRTQKATSELVRDGRGEVDDGRAESLIDSYTDVLAAIEDLDADPATASESVSTALQALESFFSPRGTLAVERTLQSFWIRHGGDPFDFPGHTSWQPEALDWGTLRDVLNGLLESGREIPEETWRRNAGFLSVDELGRVLDTPRRGGALNGMAAALIAGWTAQWVWSEQMPNPPLEETYEWLVDNKTLGLEVGDIRSFFADDGRRFKDKEAGHVLPLLSDAQEILSESGIIGVGLRKPQEGIRYEVRRSQAQPVFDRITALLSEEGSGSFQVEAVTVAVPGADHAAQIDFERQIMDLEGRPTPVTKLAQMAMRFFSKAGYTSSRLNRFLEAGSLLEPSDSDAGESADETSTATET